jgi:hypothetical protein
MEDFSFSNRLGRTWAWSGWPTVWRITSAKNANDKITKCTFGNAYSAPLYNLYDIHENSIPFLHCDLAVVYFTSLSLLNRETCQIFGCLLITRVIPTSPCLPKRLHYGGRVSHGSAPHGHAFHGHVPHRRVLRERAPHRRVSVTMLVKASQNWVVHSSPLDAHFFTYKI